MRSISEREKRENGNDPITGLKRNNISNQKSEEERPGEAKIATHVRAASHKRPDQEKHRQRDGDREEGMRWCEGGHQRRLQVETN